MQDARTAEQVQAFPLVPVSPEDKAKRGMAKTEALSQARTRWFGQLACTHTVHFSSLLILLRMYSIEAWGRLLDMSGSTLYCRRITLNGLNLASRREKDQSTKTSIVSFCNWEYKPARFLWPSLWERERERENVCMCVCVCVRAHVLLHAALLMP